MSLIGEDVHWLHVCRTWSLRIWTLLRKARNPKTNVQTFVQISNMGTRRVKETQLPLKCNHVRNVNTLSPTAPPNMLRSISHVSNFKKRYYPIPSPPPGNHDPSHQIQPGLSENSSCVFWVPTRRQIYVHFEEVFREITCPIRAHLKKFMYNCSGNGLSYKIQAGALWESYISHPFPWHAMFVVTFGCQRPPLVKAVSFSDRFHEVMKLHS